MKLKITTNTFQKCVLNIIYTLLSCLIIYQARYLYNPYIIWSCCGIAIFNIIMCGYNISQYNKLNKALDDTEKVLDEMFSKLKRFSDERMDEDND